MSDAQYYTLITVPLIGILMQTGLFLYLAHRIDKLIDTVNDINTRVKVLEKLEERK